MHVTIGFPIPTPLQRLFQRQRIYYRSREDRVQIIGGADGPTAIFVASKKRPRFPRNLFPGREPEARIPLRPFLMALCGLALVLLALISQWKRSR